MQMAADEELTPEEKLLRVIQKGDTPPSGAMPGVGNGGVATGLDSAVESTAMASGIPPAGRGLALLNRALAAAAVVFLLLAGYETYLNMPANATVYPAQPLEIGESADDAPAVSLSDTLDMLARRRVFGPAPRNDNPTGGITNVPPLIGWRSYARDNLTLMGMSDVNRVQDGVAETVREAIVMDNKVKKMLFLKQGSTLVLAEQEVSVSSIGETAIELRMGEEILKIE